MIGPYYTLELKRLLRAPFLLLAVVLFPVLLLSIVGLVIFQSMQSELEHVELVVIDDDQTFETNALIEQLAGDETLNDVITFQKKQGSVNDYREQEQIAGIIHIPDGFTAQLRQGHNEPIGVYLNESQPFASQLARLLLQSGQGYITAAQSGVNTVVHFQEDQLTNDERSQLVQDMTLHFTWLALGRNQLFDQQSLTDVKSLSWFEQGYVAGVSLLLVSTYFLFILLFKPVTPHGIEERLRTLKFTRFKQIVGEGLLHSTFLLSYVFMIAILSIIWLDVHVVSLFIQWMLVAVMFIVINLLMNNLFRTFSLKLMFTAVVTLNWLFVSGALLPVAFIPDYLSVSWLQAVQSGFYDIIQAKSVPLVSWLQVVVAIMLLVGLLSLIIRQRSESS
ncbi:hypothetical protein ABID56_001642 [Alkalibacillus flavidus]|uniref:ABC-2 type transporter transmembrane domain-containing protein n=1 Tax=Alkalibacillus flavidus TaxID=546021 RepID=A0ABV2KVF0_9BACI